MSDATPQKVWELTIEEFYRRLNDNPEELPTYVIGQILTTIARVMGQEEAPTSTEQIDPLASLENLPPDRQRELLVSELQRLDELRTKYIDLLHELENHGEQPA
jgi:hypothetical protein